MNKIYLLLRNNKQTGPYCIEEIELLKLKPTDLIWVEGQSAGWRNPLEIDALKNYVPGVSPQLARANKANDEKMEIATESVNTPINNTFKSSLQKHSKNIFVSLPSNFQVTDIVKVQEETAAEKLEKKAQELLNKVQAYSQEKNLEKNASIADIKFAPALIDKEEVLINKKEEYPNWRKQPKIAKNDSKESSWKAGGIITKSSRSLNEIKEEYSDWLKQQKKKSLIGKKSLVAATIIVGVVALAFFKKSFDQKMSASNGESHPISKAGNNKTEDVAIRKEDTLDFGDDYLPDASFFNDQMNNGQGKNVEETSSPVDPGIQEAFIEAQEAPIEKELIQPEKKEQNAESDEKDDAKLQTSITQQEKKEAGTSARNDETTIKNNETPAENRENAPVMQTASSKKEKTSVPITQLINISGDYLPSQKGDGVNGYKVTMQNNSEQTLKVVAVDVFYYAANDKLLNKKTLYFSNVSPRANMILTAPSNKDAVAVSHQLGLVSSEEGAIFFVKQ